MTVAPLSLEHLLRPSSLKEGKPPVLFMFHGYGSNEEDLFSFADDLPDQLCIISVRAPHALQPFGYAWYTINFEASYGKWSDVEQGRKSRDLILKFIDEACEAYRLDTENISLLGFSQGTVLCYAIAISHPKRFRNVIALSGYIDEQILVENYREKDHSSLKVYASHGQMDMVIPPEWAQRAPAFMDGLGIEYLYEEFPVGHGVSPGNFTSFLKWLKGKL
jgi:phospholipase/carboxylesterase